jgi:hypothetical protein
MRVIGKKSDEDILKDMKNLPKRRDITIYGLRQPQVIMRHNQDFIAIKETAFEDKRKNTGVLFPNGNTGKIVIGTERDIDREINQLGGDVYYGKYMKYKQKYLRLKAENIFV